jgi:hypothetical protein
VLLERLLPDGHNPEDHRTQVNVLELAGRPELCSPRVKNPLVRNRETLEHVEE